MTSDDINPGPLNLGNSGKSGNKKQSQMFDRDEFEEVLEETEYDWKRVDYDWTKEWVYEAKSGNGKFTARIYSSVDKRTDKSREKDSDAIRLVVLHTETHKPVLREKRTNRIKTWPKNLKKKICNIKDRAGDITMCSECGSVMVIRENSSNGNKFYGCTGYPECQYTKSIK